MKTRQKAKGGAHDGGTDAIVLPEAIDIKGARTLKARLTTLAETGAACRIEASEVTRVSAICLQILLAFGRSMAARGREVTLAAPSPALKQSLALLGLTSEFEAVFLEGR